MNLKLGICWIEDQHSEPEKYAVEQAVRRSGFEPDIHQVESEDKISTLAERQQQFQEFELILLDLNLWPGTKGHDLAPSIRASFRSTPILFYSGQEEPILRNLMAANNVDGVYCTHRSKLPTRVDELVTDLAPALNRLPGMRGLAARVVAECDEELRQILRHFASADSLELDIVESLIERLESSKERQLRKVNPIRSLNELLDQPSISSGILFQEVNRRVRDSNPSDEVRLLRSDLGDYPNKVLERRNILSHVLEERAANGWKIVGSERYPDITVDNFPTIRSDFLARLNGIQELRKLLIDEEPG